MSRSTTVLTVVAAALAAVIVGTAATGPGSDAAPGPSGGHASAGGETSPLALPCAPHEVLTEVDLTPPGDAFYPEFPASEWVEVRREVGEGCQWTWLERLDPAA